MPKNDDWGDILAAAAGMLLGYAVVKAVLDRPCHICGGMTPKAGNICKHCGRFIGRPQRW